MANRLSLPRPHVGIDADRLAAAPRRVAAWRPPRDLDRRLLVYRVVWAPFWLGSELPAPAWRAAETALPPGGLAGDHVARHLTGLARRVWILRILSVLMRALWLPVLIGCGWLLIELAGGPALRPWWLLWIGAGLLAPAVVFAWLERPSRREIARMLDRSFGLQDRMVTALDHLGKEVPAAGARAPVTYLQVADAANIVTELRTHPAFRVRPPVREIVLGIAAALLLAALYFLRGVGGGIPAVVADPVPAYVRATDRLAAAAQEPAAQTDVALADAPTAADVQAKASKSTQTQQDLLELANALDDQAVTREAADAIKAGDYAKASKLLRDVAENADQLSEPARTGLADDLDQAADAMSEGNPELADATRTAADGLRAGGEAAKAGVSELSDAVDQASSAVVPQSELADEMRRAQAADAQRQANGASAPSDPKQEDASGDPSQDGSTSSGGASQPSDGSAGGADAAPGEAKGRQPGDAAGDPNAPGNAGDTGQQPSAQEGGSPGDAESAAGVDGQEGGSASQPGEGSTSGQSAQPGEGKSGESQDATKGEGGSPGGGAGSGGQASDPNDESGTGQQRTGDTTGGQDGPPGDSEATVAEQPDGAGAGAQSDPRDSVTLPRSQDGGGIQTSGSGGSSSTGSGSGASVGVGSKTQGEVGEAGPDSNRVPAEYRGIVEDYFSDGGS